MSGLIAGEPEVEWNNVQLVVVLAQIVRRDSGHNPRPGKASEGVIIDGEVRTETIEA
jgi:hypothetical protein